MVINFPDEKSYPKICRRSITLQIPYSPNCVSVCKLVRSLSPPSDIWQQKCYSYCGPFLGPNPRKLRPDCIRHSLHMYNQVFHLEYWSHLAWSASNIEIFGRDLGCDYVGNWGWTAKFNETISAAGQEGNFGIIAESSEVGWLSGRPRNLQLWWERQQYQFILLYVFGKSFIAFWIEIYFEKLWNEVSPRERGGPTDLISFRKKGGAGEGRGERREKACCQLWIPPEA